jgi:outer membrane protein assembly factor BamB
MHDWRPVQSEPVLWNGWGPTVENTHFQAATKAGLRPEQVPHLTLKWAFGFPDATSAWGPTTIVGGRLFVGSQNGDVYSLDAKTGCVFWKFTAEGGVRGAVEEPRLQRKTPNGLDEWGPSGNRARLTSTPPGGPAAPARETRSGVWPRLSRATHS